MRDEPLAFLKLLFATPSPSGFEQPIARLFREYVGDFADRVTTDVMGNVSAAVNPEAKFRIMYAGHLDEIGFIVYYIDADNNKAGLFIGAKIERRLHEEGGFHADVGVFVLGIGPATDFTPR